MIHWYYEGSKLKQGLSLYHPKDKSSIGGFLRIGNRGIRIRYSKLRNKWFCSYNRVDPDPKVYEKFMNGN